MTLLEVCVALKKDLLDRAEIDSDGVKVVDVGATAWRNFNKALDRAIASAERAEEQFKKYKIRTREIEKLLNEVKTK